MGLNQWLRVSLGGLGLFQIGCGSGCQGVVSEASVLKWVYAFFLSYVLNATIVLLDEFSSTFCERA